MKSFGLGCLLIGTLTLGSGALAFGQPCAKLAIVGMKARAVREPIRIIRVSRDNLFVTVEGTAPKDASLIVSIEKIDLPEVRSNGSGIWAVTVPATTVTGLGKLTVRMVGSSAVGRNVSAFTLGRAPLDFDGDGSSELGAAERASGGSVSFSLPAAAGRSRESLRGAAAAPGDYDGDGIWDIATVGISGSRVVWTIKESSTKRTKQVEFGSAHGSLLTGCRLVSANKHSLVSIQGRILKATEYGPERDRRITFAKVSGGDLIGCADLSGDGVDELIFRMKSTSDQDNTLGGVGCSEDIQLYKSIRAFQRAAIIPRLTGDFPYIGALRQSGGREDLSILSINELIRFPTIVVDRGAVVSSGVVKAANGSSSTFATFTNGSGNRVFRQLLADGSAREALTSLGSGEALLQTQYLYRIVDNSFVREP